jgi:hypothetical protein
MVDNFELIESLLSFENEDEFYMLQILKRRKENPDMKGDSKPIKTVYLHRKWQLTELKDDLVFLARRHNARIYINLNVKSFRKCTCQCVAEMAKRIANDDFHKPYKIFDSVAGSAGAARDTRWVIDVDWPEFSFEQHLEQLKRQKYIKDMSEFLKGIQPVGDKVIAVVPTKNGVHIITKPFNPNEFSKVYKDESIHKNNPTLVWFD